MANTNITITWHHHGSNTTNEFVFEMSDENLMRITNAGRFIYGTENPETMITDPVTHLRASRLLSRQMLKGMREQVLQHEYNQLAANIAPIDSTEIGAEEP